MSEWVNEWVTDLHIEVPRNKPVSTLRTSTNLYRVDLSLLCSTYSHSVSLCTIQYTCNHMLVTILNHVGKFLRCDKDYYRKGQSPLSTNEQKRHNIDNNHDQFNYLVISRVKKNGSVIRGYTWLISIGKVSNWIYVTEPLIDDSVNNAQSRNWNANPAIYKCS